MQATELPACANSLHGHMFEKHGCSTPSCFLVISRPSAAACVEQLEFRRCVNSLGHRQQVVWSNWNSGQIFLLEPKCGLAGMDKCMNIRKSNTGMLILKQAENAKTLHLSGALHVRLQKEHHGLCWSGRLFLDSKKSSQYRHLCFEAPSMARRIIDIGTQGQQLSILLWGSGSKGSGFGVRGYGC